MPDPDPIIRVKIDGHPYALRPRELNAWQNATFEAETGRSVEHMMYLFSEEQTRTLVVVAQFLYLCQIQQGDAHRSFREVAERLTYAAEVTDLSLDGLTANETGDGLVAPDDGPAGLDPDADVDGLVERRADLDERLAAVGPEPSDPTSATDGSPTDVTSSSPGSVRI